MKQIVHRGYRAYGENTIMGIRSVLDCDKFCEFDILFKDGRWILSHDFQKSLQDTSDFKDLIAILPHKGRILIDLKWDFIFNHGDCFIDAFHNLEELITGIRIPWMIQAGHPYIVRFIMERHREWIVGYLMDQPCPILPVHFFMINLSRFSLSDIERLRHHGDVYGYTCKDTIHFPRYNHLSKVLTGIVIDI